MYALPPEVHDAGTSLVTGVTCPECSGSLEVEREGRGNLRFTCRVGHTLAADELLSGKEDKIESDMWASVRALEELAMLLEDLERYARIHGRQQIGGPHDGRIRQARDHARRIREILAETRAVDLTAGESAARASA